jgi:hypothetical protein
MARKSNGLPPPLGRELTREENEAVDRMLKEPHRTATAEERRKAKDELLADIKRTLK